MSLHTTIVKQLHSRPMSLAELQPVVEVSLPTLRKAVQELTQARWIRVVGQADASGGRPAKLFGLDKGYYLTVGVHLQFPGMRMAVTDLSGHVLDKREDFQDSVPRPDQVIQTIAAYVQAMRHKFAQRQILGVGIATPGFTDPDSGDIVAIGRVPGWENLPICNHLGTLLDLPVCIANDVDCMALAEYRHSKLSLSQNLAYVGLDEGIKISMYLRDAMYHGPYGNAGLIVPALLNLEETGFSRQDYNDVLTISGFNRLFMDRIASLDAADKPPYATILASQSNRQRFLAILDGAEKDLPVCVAMSRFLNTALATAIANFALIIQPDVIVIGGALSAMTPSQMAELERSIRQNLPGLIANRSIIQQAAASSDYGAAQGAVIHLLQGYLASSSDLAKGRNSA